MLIGMPFYAIFFVVLFSPPVDLNSSQISIYFGIFYVLFFIADTVCNVPYNALGPELSTDSREREKLYIIYYIFQYLGVLFASSGPVLYNKLLKSCDCSQCDKLALIEKTNCQNQCKVSCDFTSNQSSLLFMCMIIGILYVFSIVMLSLVITEKKSVVSPKNKPYVVPKFYRILNNVPFMNLLVPWILDVTISTIFATMLPFFLQVIINPQKYCLRNQIDLTNEICYTNTW
jgi:Na+/melibiose symporter-like transporter